MRVLLEEAGFEVRTLASPFGFSNVLHDERPALALVDVLMPGLSGDDLVNLVVTSGVDQGCRIVLFSDLPEDELEVLANQSGAYGFIRKGANLNGMVRAVQGMLR